MDVWASPHAARDAEEALAGIQEMIDAGVAEASEFNVRETDDSGKIVRVIELTPSAGAA